MMEIENIARVCHEANRAYCEVLGDNSQVPWAEAAVWQRCSAVEGVEFAIANPEVPVSALHDSWLDEKIKAGWKYGPVKDAAQKIHPCCIAYSELPQAQRFKDSLFRSIVQALTE